MKPLDEASKHIASLTRVSPTDPGQSCTHNALAHIMHLLITCRIVAVDTTGWHLAQMASHSRSRSI